VTPVLTDLPKHTTSRITADPATDERVWTGPASEQPMNRRAPEGTA
jgi:hypothetical protein